MRLITRNIYPVHIWNVGDYIKQAQANIIQQDSNRFVTMQNIFKKLYLGHLRDHHNTQRHAKHLRDLALMGESPARSIAQYFHKKSRQYSEGFMTATFDNVAKSYRISKNDSAGTLDTLGYQLFLSSQFSNLSEQFKYALRNNKVDFNNLVSIVNSLITMEYVDYQIFRMLLLYTQRQITCSDQFALLNNWEGDRQYQIEKDSYYKPDDIASLQAIRKSQEITIAINFIKNIYQEWEMESKQGKHLQKQGIKELNELIEEVSNTNKNFRAIVEGIINIRREYVKMVDMSSQQQIVRDPNINLELLLVEEKLLSVKLLSINDIKNVQQMKDSSLQIRRIEEILLSYLDIEKISPIFTVIDKQGIEVDHRKPKVVPDASKVSILLNLLSKYAALDRFVYHAHDGRSMGNIRWQKTLTDYHSGTYLPAMEIKQDLNVSRIFRRLFKQTSLFIHRHQSSIHNIFENASVNHKIYMMDTYCRMGLHLQAILQGNQFQNKNFSMEIEELNRKQFNAFVHVFNDIGIFINNNALKDELFEKIKKNLYLQENNQINFGLQQTIDVVNYLIQNHRFHEDYHDVYQRYVNVLESKAIYYIPEEHQKELAIEAFKILAIEKPQKYGTHPIYLNYVNNFVNDNFKKNPYHAILRQTCYKWNSKQTLLRKMSTDLNIGVNKGIQNSIVFSNSDDTSIDGQIRSGNLNSYIIRLSQNQNTNANSFSVNQFLEIDFSQEKMFRLRPKEKLEEKLNEIFLPSEQAFDKEYAQFQQQLSEVVDAFPPGLITNKIRFKLLAIQKLRSNNYNIQTKEQQFSNTCLVLLELLELTKLLSLLNKKDILPKIKNKTPRDSTLNKKLEMETQLEEYEEELKVDVHKIASILFECKYKLATVLTSTLSNSLKYEVYRLKKKQDAKLKGQRQTLQTLEQNISGVKFSSEFINYSYFNDKTFCEYHDWKKRISQKYNYAEFDTDKVSNLTKILLNKFCPGVTNKLTYLPLCKNKDRRKRLNLEFKLIRDEEEEEVHSEPKYRLNKEVDYIINLQTFKHEIKTTLSQKQLIDFIFGFKFILEMKNSKQFKQEDILQRNPEEYFNYLESINQQSYLESPYAKYIINKVSKTDKLRTLLDKRKDVRVQQRLLYQQGLISPQTYFEKINQIEDQIIEAASELKEKMLDHMENTLLDGQFKLLDIKKDQIESFEHIIRQNFSYSRQYDTDFIYANGNYEKALNLKRGRAEKNYMKFYLLKKIADQQSLSHKQLGLLKNWHQQIIKGITQFTVYESFSTMLISELPWQDLQILKLKASSLNINRDMLVVDFIMELNLFLDESIIQGYEKQVKSQQMLKRYNIPLFVFEESASNRFRSKQNEVEESIVNQNSTMSEKQIDTVEEMFRIFKTEGFRQRNNYAVLCKKFRENIEKMNKQSIRNELIHEYIRVMEEQFIKQYDPLLVQKIKEQETDILWRQIFHNPYDNCTNQQLKEVSKKLIIRIELMKDNIPPFFGNIILNLLLHPRLDSLTKQAVIAAIQYSKIDLKLDSRDIEILSDIQGGRIQSSQKAKDILLRTSNMKTSESLWSRARKWVQ